MLYVESHAKFLSKLLKLSQIKNPFDRPLEFVLSDSIHLNALHWTVTAALLLKKPHLVDVEQSLAFLTSCYHSQEGAFSSAPGHDPHILPTLFAVQIYKILGLNFPDSLKTFHYVRSLQLPNGSFMGDKWGEIDTRFSYAAISICYLLGEDLSGCGSKWINLDAALEFIEQCRNFDGGYGSYPGAETHAGQIFCCIGAITIAGRLPQLKHKEKLAWWLAERQLPGNGGLNGRPEKLEDVCYSWWVLASLEMLGKGEWIDKDALISFILSSQDPEKGGFSDRPDDCTDVFHTCFGLAALSLLGYDDIASLDARFCMIKK